MVIRAEEGPAGSVLLRRSGKEATEMKRLAAALLLAWAACCTAYYLPGTYPQEFFLGQNIQGGSNNLFSSCAECY